MSSNTACSDGRGVAHYIGLLEREQPTAFGALHLGGRPARGRARQRRQRIPIRSTSGCCCHLARLCTGPRFSDAAGDASHWQSSSIGVEIIRFRHRVRRTTRTDLNVTALMPLSKSPPCLGGPPRTFAQQSSIRGKRL
jgi:hypothetical protein